MAFHLRKVIPKRLMEILDLDPPSAEWEVDGMPGLYLHKDSSSPQKQPTWVFFIADNTNEQLPFSYSTERALLSQRFSTRREALQALEAMMTLEES